MHVHGCSCACVVLNKVRELILLDSMNVSIKFSGHWLCSQQNERMCLTFKGKKTLAGSDEGKQVRDRREPTKLTSRKK